MRELVSLPLSLSLSLFALQAIPHGPRRRPRSYLAPQQVLDHRPTRQIGRLVKRPNVQRGEYGIRQSKGEHQGDPACRRGKRGELAYSLEQTRRRR